jgi:hypothetical protein
MTTETITLATLAAEALAYFKRGDRETEGIGKILVTDNPPDWVRDMCMEAHEHGAECGPMMPNDWRYEFIGEALDIIEAKPNDDDDLHERFDEAFNTSYCESYKRTAWLASSGYRPGYVDEAQAEMGGGGDMMTAIWYGMRAEASEVFHSIADSLRQRAEEKEAATDV